MSFFAQIPPLAPKATCSCPDRPDRVSDNKILLSRFWPNHLKWLKPASHFPATPAPGVPNRKHSLPPQVPQPLNCAVIPVRLTVHSTHWRVTLDHPNGKAARHRSPFLRFP